MDSIPYRISSGRVDHAGCVVCGPVPSRPDMDFGLADSRLAMGGCRTAVLLRTKVASALVKNSLAKRPGHKGKIETSHEAIDANMAKRQGKGPRQGSHLKILDYGAGRSSHQCGLARRTLAEGSSF